MIKHQEHADQKELIKWARYHALKYPGIELLFAIPNGGLLAAKNEMIEGRNGKRISLNRIRGKRLKDMGLVTGAADLFLPVPRFVYHGLFIEMKKTGGHPSDVSHEQIGFGNSMIAQGYAFDVAYGWEHGAEIIQGYYTGIMPKTGKAFVMPKFKVTNRGVFADEFSDLPF